MNGQPMVYVVTVWGFCGGVWNWTVVWGGSSLIAAVWHLLRARKSGTRLVRLEMR